MDLSSKEKFMRRAVELSFLSIKNGGGPFGAVIVKDGEIVAEGSNEVTKTNDPTAHAEMVTIRRACKNLNTYDLQGCEIYTSCEPCPMCLSGIMWARIEKIYYANSRKDAAKIGFDDAYFYDQVSASIKERDIQSIRILEKEAHEVFEAWENKEDKIPY
jgi:tRNA(Arg) A34 adenosine deaminase TadA